MELGGLKAPKWVPRAAKETASIQKQKQKQKHGTTDPLGLPDNGGMQIRFTKMHGAGNDFVVLDETQHRLNLSAAQYRFLADRHFGVGADQILTVRPSPADGVDFEYIIHNADGGEVGQCGNGARCFARFVHDQGLTKKTVLRVRTRSGDIQPVLTEDGRVRVDMGLPRFALPDIPFDGTDLAAQSFGAWERWRVRPEGAPASLSLAGLVSMGNPHAVLCVASTEQTDVQGLGAEVQANPRFTEGVNVGFMQVISRQAIQLRVFERGVGETLACGTGACAAVVAGIRWGLLDPMVEVHTRGGDLQIAWSGGNGAVAMTGPAIKVFEGQLVLPDLT